MDELLKELWALVDMWRDEECDHTWVIKHALNEDPAELICATELAAVARKYGGERK